MDRQSFHYFFVVCVCSPRPQVVTKKKYFLLDVQVGQRIDPSSTQHESKLAGLCSSTNFFFFFFLFWDHTK